MVNWIFIGIKNNKKKTLGGWHYLKSSNIRRSNILSSTNKTWKLKTRYKKCLDKLRQLYKSTTNKNIKLIINRDINYFIKKVV